MPMTLMHVVRMLLSHEPICRMRLQQMLPGLSAIHCRMEPRHVGSMWDDLAKPRTADGLIQLVMAVQGQQLVNSNY